MKAYVPVIAAVALIVAGAFWYTRSPDTVNETRHYTETANDSYVYTCDSGVEFVLKPIESMASVVIEPISDMSYPAKSVLYESPTDAGRRYRSGTYEIHGRGETVSLYDVRMAKAYTCEPQPKPDEAPLNFGD